MIETASKCVIGKIMKLRTPFGWINKARQLIKDLTDPVTDAWPTGVTDRQFEVVAVAGQVGWVALGFYKVYQIDVRLA
jgi:hypothetical protein